MMKKITLLILFSAILWSCEISQESDLEFIQEEEETGFTPCNFQGREYMVTSYLYDIPFDLNNDGMYSNDILDEAGCYVSTIEFDENDSALNMLSQFANATVTTDVNGNLVQSSGCTFSDGAKLTCLKNGQAIILNFNNAIVYEGTSSSNDSVITFTIPYETLRQYHLGYHNILNEDGTITNYEVPVTITFELQ